MAKADRMNRKKKDDAVVKNTHLATTPDMIVKTLDSGDIVAKDDNGMYLTKKHYVGTGLLDPYRSREHMREDYVETEA